MQIWSRGRAQRCSTGACRGVHIFGEVGYLACEQVQMQALVGTSRAEKRKWLRHCPAASNVGSSARSFKVIGEKTTAQSEKTRSALKR